MSDFTCEKCGRSFGNASSLKQHENDAHKTEHKSAQRKKLPVFWIAAAAVIILAIAGTALMIGGNAATQSIDGIECSSSEQLSFHIHTHLDVFVNGTQQSVPANIGLPGCTFWLHTHDVSGIIHIEAPQQQAFTLGQFIDIWNASTVSKIPQGTPVAYVNGQQTGNYRDVQMNAHDEISLVYGTPPQTIPSSFDFGPGY